MKNAALDCDMTWLVWIPDLECERGTIFPMWFQISMWYEECRVATLPVEAWVSCFRNIDKTQIQSRSLSGVCNTTPSYILMQSGNMLISNSDYKKTTSIFFFKNTIKHFWSENFFRRVEQKCFGYGIRLTRNARICNARSGKVVAHVCRKKRLKCRSSCVS